jgi:hypothetical protein
LTGGSRRGAAQSLFKSALRHRPQQQSESKSSPKSANPRAPRCRNRWRAPFWYSNYAITCGIVILDVQLAVGRAERRK